MKIETKLMLTTLLLLSSAFLVYSVAAGWNNQNDSNGKSYERGTGQNNGMTGCIAQGGMKAVDLGPPLGAVWGGACCASSEYLYTTTGENMVYAPNQCCNPPDFIATQPGNHCECFEIRGYTSVP